MGKLPDKLLTLVEAACGQGYIRFISFSTPSSSSKLSLPVNPDHLRLFGKAGNISRARGTLRRTARTREGARYPNFYDDDENDGDDDDIDDDD